MTERKMRSDNGPIGNLIDWVKDKIADLFSRTEEVEQANPERQPDDADAGGSDRNLTNTALRGALQTLQEQLDEVTSDWSAVSQKADDAKQQMDDLQAGIRALTEQFATQYAANTAETMATKLAEIAGQWDDLNGQAETLRSRVLELQEQVKAVEAQIEGKAVSVGLESKRGLIDIERKHWVNLMIDLGQAAALGTGWTGVARGLVMLTRSMYERALDFFTSEEERLQEQLAKLRDSQADIEAKLKEIQDARTELEDDFEREGVEDDYAAENPDNPFGYGLKPKSAGAHHLYR